MLTKPTPADRQVAYSVLDVRAVGDDGRRIEGIASTPKADRMGDIVEPLGARFALPMPLLWQHDSHQPVGQVEFAKPTKAGIPFKATLVSPADVESETLKQRLLEAADSIRTGLVKAVSIGFRPIEWSIMEDGGWRFLEWEWMELSLVTIPANAEAVITTLKQFDVGRPADREDPAQIADLDQALQGKTVHVAKLAVPARARAPFVINRINHLA